jgi:enterochelin esterase-like enzyme
MNKINHLLLLISIAFLGSCHSKIKERKDEVYSRHLQKHIIITVISTPVPNNKSDFNLLLLNDGQDIEKLRVKTIVDSLYKINLIRPLIVVGIDAFDRMQEYGVAGKPDYQGNGASAEKYAGFVTGELLPFVKKKAGVRKFSSITIAGCSLGGLSAFDIAWDNADKIDKAGVFSGSFWLRDKDSKDSSYSDDKDRLIINKIRSSRKRPHLQYWFYVGDNEEKAEGDKDGIIDAVDDTKDLIDLIKKKNVAGSGDITYVEEKNGTHDYDSWSHIFPLFLIWAVGK